MFVSGAVHFALIRFMVGVMLLCLLVSSSGGWADEEQNSVNWNKDLSVQIVGVRGYFLMERG